ncbi:MAG: GLUG motif-containing protein [bacterium]
MKKLSLIILTLIIGLALSANLMAYSGGSGTSGDPFQIATPSDLITLSNTNGDWGLTFIQTANISFDANEQNVDWDGDGTANWDAEDQLGFSPIGNSSIKFTGSYNGQDHTIDGLFIYRPSTNYIGLFGSAEGTEIDNLGVTNVDITGLQAVGGLLGMNYTSSTVSNCYATGSVSGLSAVSYLGGLVGRNYNATLSNSYSTCSVDGGSYIGGLVGHNYSSTISNSYATGSVIGNSQVGGLLGVNATSSTVSNSYATGSVAGTERLGGLIGQNSVTVSNCYSTGTVGAGSFTGGLVGLNDGPVSNSFWDTQTSGRSTSAGGTGKTTAEMKTLSTFTDAGWDFMNETANGSNDYWGINANENSGYPFLEWQGHLPVNDPPVITSSDNVSAVEDVLFTYTATATDPEDSSVTFSFEDLPDWLSAGPNSVSGIPVEGMQDTSFSVIASDGELKDTSTVILTVIVVNDPPVISTIPDISFNEDGQLKFSLSYFYAFVNDPDNADSSLIWSFSDTDNVSITMDNDSVTLSSENDWFGKDSLSAKISDSEFSDETYFVVTVRPVNDSPYFTELMPDSILLNSTVRDTLLLTEFASDIDNPDTSLTWLFVHSSFILCDINDTLNSAIFWTEENVFGRDTVIMSVSDGEFTIYDSLIFIVNHVSGIEYLMSEIPQEFSLKQNYPNPFNPTTTIIYGLPKCGHVDIRIYDLLGREVITLVNADREAKHYQVIWNAKDKSGNTVPSGMYLYRIVATSGDRTFVKSRKLLLMR